MNKKNQWMFTSEMRGITFITIRLVPECAFYGFAKEWHRRCRSPCRQPEVTQLHELLTSLVA